MTEPLPLPGLRQGGCCSCGPVTRAAGAARGGTDLGQTGNPTPADGLQMFVTGLMAAGITRQQIDIMGTRGTGRALLMG